MPDFVINTGPLIALSVAVGRLDFLDQLYRDIRVPKEVFQELQAGGAQCPEIQMISQVKCMTVATNEILVPNYLKAELDLGEGRVIQTAIVQKIPLVVIDEKQGRCIARLHGLCITGSLGILVKAAKKGLTGDLGVCFDRMKAHGIWIAQSLKDLALRDVQN